jgi:hypothetical protein
MHQYVGLQSDIGANGSPDLEKDSFFDHNNVTISANNNFDAPRGDCAKILGLACSLIWSKQPKAERLLTRALIGRERCIASHTVGVGLNKSSGKVKS